VLKQGIKRERGGIDAWARSGLKWIQTNSNTIQTISNPIKLHLIQPGPSRGQKNEVKYDFERLERMNNFVHRNYSILEMDFELKI
jgi:hypothetical protein